MWAAGEEDGSKVSLGGHQDTLACDTLSQTLSLGGKGEHSSKFS